jgi:hypothetical protein
LKTVDCFEGYGPLVQNSTDPWSLMYKVFDIENVTDEGFERMDVPYFVKQILILLRDTKDPEERMKILREQFYIDNF